MNSPLQSGNQPGQYNQPNMNSNVPVQGQNV